MNNRKLAATLGITATVAMAFVGGLLNGRASVLNERAERRAQAAAVRRAPRPAIATLQGSIPAAAASQLFETHNDNSRRRAPRHHRRPDTEDVFERTEDVLEQIEKTLNDLLGAHEQNIQNGVGVNRPPHPRATGSANSPPGHQ